MNFGRFIREMQPRSARVAHNKIEVLPRFGVTSVVLKSGDGDLRSPGSRGNTKESNGQGENDRSSVSALPASFHVETATIWLFHDDLTTSRLRCLFVAFLLRVLQRSSWSSPSESAYSPFVFSVIPLDCTLNPGCLSLKCGGDGRKPVVPRLSACGFSQVPEVAASGNRSRFGLLCHVLGPRQSARKKKRRVSDADETNSFIWSKPVLHRPA